MVCERGEGEKKIERRKYSSSVLNIFSVIKGTESEFTPSRQVSRFGSVSLCRAGKCLCFLFRIPPPEKV